MWRKNRNPANFVNCSANNDLGNGIDLNRNFDFVWMCKYCNVNFFFGFNFSLSFCLVFSLLCGYLSLRFNYLLFLLLI